MPMMHLRIPSRPLLSRLRVHRVAAFSSAAPPTPPPPSPKDDCAAVVHRMRRPIAGAASTVPLNLRDRSPAVAPERPPHHTADGAFQNPWPSYVDYGPLDYFSSGVASLRKLDTYALPAAPIAWDALAAAPPDDVQAMWIGHATFFAQLGGWNVLTDPMFSKRASPTQLLGPARYTPPACSVDELPPLHLVLVSHSHYDHLDAGSIRAVLAKEKRDLLAQGAKGGSRRFTGTLWACPLRVRPLLERFGVPADQIVELDWWDAFTPALHEPGEHAPSAGAASLVPNALAGTLQRGWRPGSSAVVPAELHAEAPTIVCVPAQHQSARTPFDRNHTLWAGFVVVCPQAEPPPAAAAAASVSGGDAAAPPPRRYSRLYFSGDTGYRSVPKGAEPFSSAEEDAPACPAFRDIGALYGPLDLALLPIGAYSPRWFMSSFHGTPEDAVAMHVDLRARRSVAMHWGTFPLTDEPIEEPPARLAAACAAKGLPPNEFVAVRPGSLVRGAGGAVPGAAAVVEGRTPAGEAIAAAAAQRPPATTLTFFERLRAYL